MISTLCQCILEAEDGVGIQIAVSVVVLDTSEGLDADTDHVCKFFLRNANVFAAFDGFLRDQLSVDGKVIVVFSVAFVSETLLIFFDF